MSGQKPVVMVVDDEQGVLDVVGRYAQRVGYDVVTCGSGRDAIAQLQTVRADLVMVDLRMPEIGGRGGLRAVPDLDPPRPEGPADGLAAGAAPGGAANAGRA